MKLASEYPPTVSVVGYKDSGKTSIAVGIIRSLRKRGWRVMSVKHGHHHDIDRAGTDSWRLRHEGGAEKVVLAGPEGFAVMGDWGMEGELSLQEITARDLTEADVVIAEGYKSSSVHKIEVWRSGMDNELLCKSGNLEEDLYLAVVSDSESLNVAVPTFHFGQLDLFDCLSDLVESRILKSKNIS